MSDHGKLLQMLDRTITKVKTFAHPFDCGVIEIHFYLDDGTIIKIANKVPGPSFIIWDESNENN